MLILFPPLIFFVEFGGFEFDRNKFPSEFIRKEFLKHFLLQTKQLQLDDSPSLNNFTPIPCENGVISEDFIAGVDVSASCLRLLSIVF